VAKKLSDLAGWVTRANWPRVLCPECLVGTVALDKADEIMDLRSVESVRLARAGEGPQEELTGTFTGTLLCDNSDCSSRLAVAGDWGYFYDFDIFDGYGQPTLVDSYRVKYVNPALPMIRLPARAPAAVKASVSSAAAVFFLNPNAAAGRLRHAVEALMDAQRVPKTALSSKTGKRVRKELHARIEQFRSTQPDIADVLLAVKWIGNEGAHGEEMSVRDVEMCGLPLEAALAALYGRDDDELRRLVRAINRHKGLGRRKKSAP
jgi:hypothetical protein